LTSSWRFRHHHQRGTNEAIVSTIPTLYLGRDGAGGMLGALEMLDRLVKGRIEWQPDARNPLHTQLRQCVRELPNDHPDTLRHGLNVRRLLGVRHRTLEIVENREEIAKEVFARLFLAFGLLAPRACGNCRSPRPSAGADL